jgi:hypothetical protein
MYKWFSSLQKVMNTSSYLPLDLPAKSEASFGRCPSLASLHRSGEVGVRRCTESRYTGATVLAVRPASAVLLAVNTVPLPGALASIGQVESLQQTMDEM